MQEIPVYLFLGFLESGKTKFIQETLEDERFDSGERTLLLVMEEGEEEYDHAKFANPSYAVEVLDPSQMNEKTLSALAEKYSSERVVVEYNGMSSLQDFFDAMPEGWAIAQVMTFFDANTFLSYNKNMRQLVFDKIQYADMVVFNRFKGEFSKEEFHKVVRAMSRRPGIVYEYLGGKAEYDEIVDPLPYDIDAPVITIEDKDYAFFYRDLVEETEKYNRKTVHFKGLVAVDKSLKRGTIVVGRHIMTCCEADIAYSGIVLEQVSGQYQTRDWVELTARIELKYHSVYGQKGPVLKAIDVQKSTPPEQELATFY